MAPKFALGSSISLQFKEIICDRCLVLPLFIQYLNLKNEFRKNMKLLQFRNLLITKRGKMKNRMLNSMKVKLTFTTYFSQAKIK